MLPYDKIAYLSFIVIIIIIILGSALIGPVPTLAAIGVFAVGYNLLSLLTTGLLRKKARKTECKKPEQPLSIEPRQFAVPQQTVQTMLKDLPSLDVDEAVARKNYFSNRQAKKAIEYSTHDRIKATRNIYGEELENCANQAWWDNDSLDEKMQHVF